MVIEYENFIPSHKLSVNKESEIYLNMDKTICNSDNNKQEDSIRKKCSKSYVEDMKSNNELIRDSIDSNFWWSNDDEEGKLDSRQRWSFGSDISIEATENVQNRLCCSPVDEFDCIVNNENDLIVNGTDERDESYKNFIQISSPCSPTFKKVISNDNKKQSKNHDVDTADDELIDYSKRYTTDSSMSIVENKHMNLSDIQQERRKNLVVNNVTRCVPEKKSIGVNKLDPYGDYPETDLDQPTNYSLRYAEEDSDEEEDQDTEFYCNGDQDTIKTYYTEGTPYQTPCNFSTATSMSDLLSLEDIKQGDEATYKRQVLKDQKLETVEKSEKAVKDCKNWLKKKYISRDSKISVVDEIRETNDKKNCEENLKKLHTPPQSPIEPEPCDKEKESKAVTFNIEENYAQETPLMFSRSSSLDSLSEFEQHSIHDDQSSIISDHSRRTSGIVSPSELPDSPTQIVSSHTMYKNHNFHQAQTQRITVRSSTKKSHAQHNDDTKNLEKNLSQNCKVQCEKSTQLIECCSVFEDGLVTFKEESIPSKMQSTTISSLSSLTIDEEEDNDIAKCNNRQILNKIASIKVRTSAAGMHQAPVQKQYCSDSFNEIDKLPCQPQPNEILNRNSDYQRNCSLRSPIKENVCLINFQEDDNEYMAYVNKDVEKVIYRKSIKYSWYEDELKNNNRNHSNSVLSSPSCINNDRITSLQKLEAEFLTEIDTIRVYCTENTPTFASPCGSQSNLSALSMLSVSEENLGYSSKIEDDEQQEYNFYDEERLDGRLDPYGTDASSDFSEDNEKCYDEEGPSCNMNKRIDVSPFDSQINLANFSLLCIQEESDEELENEKVREKKQDQEEPNEEDDKPKKDCHHVEEDNAYRRRTRDNSDYSDEDSKVLQECINSGVSKLTRRTSSSDVDKRYLF